MNILLQPVKAITAAAECVIIMFEHLAFIVESIEWNAPQFFDLFRPKFL